MPKPLQQFCISTWLILQPALQRSTDPS